MISCLKRYHDIMLHIMRDLTMLLVDTVQDRSPVSDTTLDTILNVIKTMLNVVLDVVNTMLDTTLLIHTVLLRPCKIELPYLMLHG